MTSDDVKRRVEAAIAVLKAERDAAIQRAETAERELALLHESLERGGAGRCSCDHAPCRHDAHRFISEREAETARADKAERERDEALARRDAHLHEREKELLVRDDLRAKLSKALSDYAEVAHAVGIEYVSDYISAPGPIEAIIAAIEELCRADARRIDAETKLSACVAALEAQAEVEGLPRRLEAALAAAKGSA